VRSWWVNKKPKRKLSDTVCRILREGRHVIGRIRRAAAAAPCLQLGAGVRAIIVRAEEQATKSDRVASARSAGVPSVGCFCFLPCASCCAA
jgi:hypothetical protein